MPRFPEAAGGAAGDLKAGEGSHGQYSSSVHHSFLLCFLFFVNNMLKFASCQVFMRFSSIVYKVRVSQSLDIIDNSIKLRLN